jgi:hypothetical protein
VANFRNGFAAATAPLCEGFKNCSGVFQEEPMKKVVFVFVLVTLCASAAMAGELIVNGGFESGARDPWYNARNFCGGPCQDWAATNSNSHSGSFSAMDIGNIELRQDFTPVPGSSITSASFWVNNSAGVNAFDFFYTDSSDEEFVVFPNAGTWTFEDVTADINPSKTLMGFSIWGCDTGCITYVDDVSIQSSVPEPSTLAMLGTAGLAGIGFLRRKLGV